MSTEVATGLLLVGLLLITGLAFYAYCLRQQVAQKEQAEREAQQARQLEARTKTLESIHIIAQCALDDQVEIMEASIRLRVLLDIFDADLLQQPEFSVLLEITRRGQHFATHQARKELSKQARMKQDFERIALEGEYREAVLTTARNLLQLQP
ncbi:Protein of unknown function [Oceanospirillum multiglobuliferum]|uniref:DUF2489 domain-containing protein n=1 Tax=Oceanospirillum multiglobuliferum TaxID=64969 RepID=A0A1T4KGX9_9GAMM|nr:DUF2489 domain-containing protein [Oceanospirillum multiglobuliferum]OPX56033.1 hypothetical protein BTE48_05595 [Oceanospirillum multiglobuliferum]SJZ41654.1 Protein of unknown function [Oceanospirillum multiglobuliferum]